MFYLPCQMLTAYERRSPSSLLFPDPAVSPDDMPVWQWKRLADLHCLQLPQNRTKATRQTFFWKRLSFKRHIRFDVQYSRIIWARIKIRGSTQYIHQRLSCTLVRQSSGYPSRSKEDVFHHVIQRPLQAACGVTALQASLPKSRILSCRINGIRGN